jgi:hypothetical protein
MPSDDWPKEQKNTHKTAENVSFPGILLPRKEHTILQSCATVILVAGLCYKTDVLP